MEEQKQIDRNRKKYQNVICICADVNNLKQINDEDGHLIGDQVLCRVAAYLRDFFQSIWQGISDRRR